MTDVIAGGSGSADEREAWMDGLRSARGWGRHFSVKVTGLVQKLGQLEAGNRDLQSKSWANLNILGQPCNFYAWGQARSLLAGRSRVRVGQFSEMAEGQDAGRYNGLHEPYMTYHGARMNL